MGHIIVLSAIIAIVVSTSGTYSAIQIYRAYRIPLLRNYIHYLVLWNVLSIINLIAMYVSVNISSNADPGSINLLWKIITLLETAVFALIFYSVSIILGKLLGKDSPRILRLTVVFLFIGLLIAAWLAAGLFINGIPFGGAGAFTVKAFQILLVFISVVLFFFSRRFEPRNKRRVVRIFSLFLMSAYACMFLTFILTTKDSLIIVSLLYAAISILQSTPIKWFLIGFYGEMPLARDYKEVFNEILHQYNISEREKDIIEMIIHGKSNKEIEQELFISSHTVKNHIYNIFQKTGVKSRNQLICLILNNKP